MAAVAGVEAVVAVARGESRLKQGVTIGREQSVREQMKGVNLQREKRSRKRQRKEKKRENQRMSIRIIISWS